MHLALPEAGGASPLSLEGTFRRKLKDGVGQEGGAAPVTGGKLHRWAGDGWGGDKLHSGRKNACVWGPAGKQGSLPRTLGPDPTEPPGSC